MGGAIVQRGAFERDVMGRASLLNGAHFRPRRGVGGLIVEARGGIVGAGGENAGVGRRGQLDLGAALAAQREKIGRGGMKSIGQQV